MKFDILGRFQRLFSEPRAKPAKMYRASANVRFGEVCRGKVFHRNHDERNASILSVAFAKCIFMYCIFVIVMAPGIQTTLCIFVGGISSLLLSHSSKYSLIRAHLSRVHICTYRIFSHPSSPYLIASSARRRFPSRYRHESFERCRWHLFRFKQSRK